MRYRIEGVDRETGEDAGTLEVVADSEDLAIVEASDFGILTKSIQVISEKSEDVALKNNTPIRSRKADNKSSRSSHPGHMQPGAGLLCLWGIGFVWFMSMLICLASGSLAGGTTAGVIVTVICLYLAFRILASVLRYEAAHPTKHRSPYAKIICPHCQTKGSVTVSERKVKKGISGSKATATLLTGGVSLLAVGLSRKEMQTQMKCSNCGVTWVV